MTAGPLQVQQERDQLYQKFTAAIQEVQQKTGFKNLVLERKLKALSTAVEQKEAQLNEVLATSNLDPAALTIVSRKLEVSPRCPPALPKHKTDSSAILLGYKAMTVLNIILERASVIIKMRGLSGFSKKKKRLNRCEPIKVH